MTAVAVPAAAKPPEFVITHKNGPGTSVHSGSIYARGAHARLSRRPLPSSEKKERCTWAIRSRSDSLARCDSSEKMKMQAGLERRKSYAHLDARSKFLSLSAPSGEGAARNARLRRRLRSRPKIP